MTKHKDRKQQIRARMAADGVPYSEAARRIGSEARAAEAGVREREWKIRERMRLSRFPMAYAAAEILVDRQARGLPDAPENWRSAMPHTASTYRDNAGIRVVEVLDAVTDRSVCRITVAYQDPDELEAGYRADVGEDRVSLTTLTVMRLGRPDLVLHQLGWESLGDWREWPDGTWRCAARPFDRMHRVRAEPLAPHHSTIGSITVWESPGPRIVADEIIEPVSPHDTRALDAALNKLGYTVDRWEILPGGARYGAARPGRLAERDWSRRARVRIIKETTVGAVDPPVERTFKVGEELEMNQRGRAGEEIRRDNWWTSSDIDGAHIIDADCAEIVEILDDEPPTWAEAALPADEVTRILAPHHPGAAEAAAAWEAAGLLVCRWARGLAIYTPGPEYRMVGRCPSDYWNRGTVSLPYEAIVGGDPLHYRKLDRLPLDPVAASTIVHAFNGHLVCGRDRLDGEYVSTDWDEVTCWHCHQVRIRREQMADELADVHAESARAFAADTGTAEQPEQAFSRTWAEARRFALADYDYAARMARQLADIRRRWFADRERDPGEALARYRRDYAAALHGAVGEPGRDIQDDPFGGHEFEYESSTDLFRCTECRQYEFTARQNAPDGISITPCPGWMVEGDPYRAYLLVTDNPEIPEGGYGAALANRISRTGLGRAPRYSWRAGRLLVQSAPTVVDELAWKIKEIRFDVDGLMLPAAAAVERVSVEAARDILAENYAAYVAEYGKD